MAILDQYGTPISSASRHFAAGADRSDRSRPPENLFKDDIEKLIPSRDREWLLSGSRRLFQNFPPLKGAITQRADHVVGRAWMPKFTGEDKEWGKLAAEWLTDQWYGNCDIRGRAWDFKTLLWLDCVATDRDGDFLIYFVPTPSGYPLTQRIPANRIGQRGWSDKVEKGPYKGAKISHGVVLDKYNRAIAFHVLGENEKEDRFIDASDCIHVFDPVWHDQVRGLPSASGALKFLYGSLSATEREQLNQIIRSHIALIEYNDHGGPDLDDPSVQIGAAATAESPATPTVENLAGGAIKYFRSNSGGKVEAIDNNMPGDAWDRFQDRIVRILANDLNWPYPLFWKEGDVNAALVRNIQEKARQSVEDRQDVLKSPAIFTIRWAVAKAIKIGLLPKPKNESDWWKWDFQMPRKFSIDAAKDAQQRREDWKIGYRSRRGIAEEDGLNAEQIEDEKIEEAFRLEKKIREREQSEGFTIDRRAIQMLSSNEAPKQADAAEQQDEEESQKEDEK